MSNMPRQEVVLQAKCACGRHLTSILVGEYTDHPHYVTGCAHCIAVSLPITTPSSLCAA
jgi:hypothetical protein